MRKFVIEPHFRLQEWVADAKGYFTAAGLDYVFHEEVRSTDGKILGVSKLARLSETFARRLQLQERLTSEIANTLFERLKPLGVMVVIEAEHTCMTLRGVKKPGAMTVTSAVLGGFRKDPRTRAEAMALITGKH